MLSPTQKNKLPCIRGFSLIEVLVSLSIFTIVVTISVGALMVLIEANARAQNSQTVMTNLSFALDSITREIRTGTDYFCGGYAILPTSGSSISNCVSGDNALSINEGGQSLTENASSRRIGIRLNNGALERRLGNGDGDGNVNEAEDWIPMTSESVNVTDLRFYVTGATRSDTESPTVTLYVAGTSGEEGDEQAEFSIQTTVVQQLLDI
jgi:prepilin-type N-terminal cleavage/methylation domain-containing protein